MCVVVWQQQSDQQLFQRQLPNGQDGRINVLGTAIARGGGGSLPLAMAPPYSQQFAQLGLHTGLAPVAGWSDVLPTTVPKQAKDTRLMPVRICNCVLCHTLFKFMIVSFLELFIVGLYISCFVTDDKYLIDLDLGFKDFVMIKQHLLSAKIALANTYKI